MRWSCMCGRSFTKAKMCLKCGDRLPHLVADGEITYELRRTMSRGEYQQWLAELDAKNQLKVTYALSDLKNLISELEDV